MKTTLGNYQIMITSKYFESIEDYINLEMAVKRFEGNMERFHFNPIPLNDNTRKFFPNLETLHLYNEDDQVFSDGRIYKHCIWYRINYRRYLNDKEKEYKRIRYSKKDRIKYGDEIPKEVNILGKYFYNYSQGPTSLIIPNSIVKIENNCFNYCDLLTSIEIPNSVARIGKGCFNKCSSLESIKLSLSITKIPKECFNECDSLSSIEIPNSVTKLGMGCFGWCTSLQRVEMPSSLVEIGFGCFKFCGLLKSVAIPSSVSKFGYGCFYKCEQLSDRENIPNECFEYPGVVY